VNARKGDGSGYDGCFEVIADGGTDRPGNADSGLHIGKSEFVNFRVFCGYTAIGWWA
jgi:hypothetical protein